MAMKSAMGHRGLANTDWHCIPARNAFLRVWTEPREDTDGQVVLGSLELPIVARQADRGYTGKDPLYVGRNCIGEQRINFQLFITSLLSGPAALSEYTRLAFEILRKP